MQLTTTKQLAISVRLWCWLQQAYAGATASSQQCATRYSAAAPRRSHNSKCGSVPENHGEFCSSCLPQVAVPCSGLHALNV
jgi:hypothetical protein